MVGFRGIIIATFFCLLSAALHSQVVLDSIVVKAKKERISTAIYTPQKARMLISVTGENDPLKLIQSQSGVSTGVEGTSSIFVRGGNNGNNRIEMDGIPFYDSGHLLGLISSFPSGIIDNISFRKGGQSSSKGDFSASLTEIKTKNFPDGSSVTLSPFFAGLFNSGYLSKQKKVSYITSARYTLLDPLWKVAKKWGSIDNIEFKPISGDVFFKLNLPLSYRNNVYAGLYYSNDDISFSESAIDMSINWGNKTVYASWEYLPVNWLTIETKGYYLNYKSAQSQESNQADQLNTLLSINEVIDEYAIKTMARVKYKRYSLTTGFEVKQRKFYCASNAKQSNFSDTISSLFVDFEYSSPIISAMAGIRKSRYSMNYYDLHLDVSAHLGTKFGAEITVDKMHQFSHIAEGGLVGWRDFLIPAYDSLPPEKCNQFYIGGYYSGKNIKVSLGAYYKVMNNLTSLRRASDLFFMNYRDWSQILEIGTGKSIGIESSIEATINKFSTNISYTLSKTDRKFDEINEGRQFPFQYDRRHILNLISSYIIKEKRVHNQLAKLNITYTSGGYATIPISRYQAADLPYLGHFINDGTLTDLTLYHLQSLLIVPGTNGFRMPSYFRIDAGYIFCWKRKQTETELSLGITNVLNRHNASLVYYSNGFWRQLSIIPILPSIGLKIKF
ncbi:MAG: TonB-dependent receptor [Bacteroidales bacterium]|nr:TonB-dependent receptor [Bacteroidales bacterium]